MDGQCASGEGRRTAECPGATGTAETEEDGADANVALYRRCVNYKGPEPSSRGSYLVREQARGEGRDVGHRAQDLRG